MGEIEIVSADSNLSIAKIIKNDAEFTVGAVAKIILETLGSKNKEQEKGKGKKYEKINITSLHDVLHNNFPSQSNKPVIAVGEITSAVGGFNTLSIQLALENALQKTNKYTMMERIRLDALLQERGLSMSGVTDGRADISGFSGVDYLVYGSVSNISIERTNALIAFSCDASLSMNVRVVDVNSGEIRLSESVFVEKNLQTVFDENVDPCGGITLSNINIMGEDTSDDIANKLTTAIFPIKVARVSKGQVYL